MVQTRMREDFKARADGTSFRVIASVNEASYAGLDDRAGAHAAGFNRDI